MKFKIETNISRIAPYLQKLAKEEIPFATAITLTDLGKMVNANAKEEMRRVFNIRDKYVLNNFRLVRAEKRDWPKCKAEAGTRLKFMEQQTEGGVKRDKNGQVLGVPRLGSITRPTIMDRIPQSLYARKVLNFKKNDFGIKKTDFFGITDRSGTRPLFFQTQVGRRTNRHLPAHLRRKKKGRHSKSKRGWVREIIYFLSDQVKIPARFKFEKLARETVEKNYEKVFKDNLNKIFK